jgi:hypothetical protein
MARRFRIPRGRPNHAGNPSGRRLFGSVRGEDVKVHRGTQAARVNVLFSDSSENQLIAIGPDEVEAHSAFSRRHEPPVDQVSVMSRSRERVHEL